MNSLFILDGTTAATSGICGEDFLPIWNFIGVLISILRWGIPVILVVLGTVDVGKAVVSGDDKKQKTAYQTFLRRLIAAIVVFFVPAIVGFIMGAVTDPKDTTGFTACMDAMGLSTPAATTE